MQTSIPSRRKAEGPEYHLAATNGLEPIQTTEAWRTAGQEAIGTATIQESHSVGTGEAQLRTQEAAVRSKTPGERGEGPRSGRRHKVSSQTLWPTGGLETDTWVAWEQRGQPCGPCQPDKSSKKLQGSPSQT